MSRSRQDVVLSRVRNTTRSLAVFGAAGTGKSHLRDVIASLVPCIVLGPTGISVISAANGMTVARFLGAQKGDNSIEALVANFVPPRNLSAFTIVVDEISMMSPKELTALDQCLRKTCNPHRVCGGLRVIMIGDPLQLEPVDAPLFFFETDTFRNLVKAGLEVHVLGKNWRLDSNDEDIVDMATFMEDCRRGRLSTTSTSIIRYVLNRRRKPDDAVRLFAENADVDAYNSKRFDAYPGLAVSHKGKEYKPGIPVIVVENNYDQNKLTCANGTVGVVDSVSSAGVVVKTAVGTIQFSRKAPVKYAWALTIAKAQGLTLPAVVVSGKGLHHAGQAYVAISRVRRLADLYGEDLTADNFTVPCAPALNAFKIKYGL